MANRRMVSWTNSEDFNCVLLGSLGFSSKFINQKTGLSPGQIVYRLRKADVRRMEFRNGESPEAYAILRHHHKIAEPVLIRRLPRIEAP